MFIFLNFECQINDLDLLCLLVEPTSWFWWPHLVICFPVTDKFYIFHLNICLNIFNSEDLYIHDVFSVFFECMANNQSFDCTTLV